MLRFLGEHAVICEQLMIDGTLDALVYGGTGQVFGSRPVHTANFKDSSPSIIQYAKLCVDFVRPIPGKIERDITIRHVGC
jgi:hypothetical protein